MGGKSSWVHQMVLIRLLQDTEYEEPNTLIRLFTVAILFTFLFKFVSLHQV